MVIVKVNGVDYQIEASKLNELLVWLEKNKVSNVLDNVNPDIKGRSIING